MRVFVLNHNYYIDDGTGFHERTLDVALDHVNGNAGNTYITYSVAKFIDFGPTLQGIANIWQEGALARITPEEVNAQYDYVLLMMQDQIQPACCRLPWLTLANWITKLRIPIIPFSVGANWIDDRNGDISSQLSHEMIFCLKTLSEMAPSIGVRGDYTAEILHKIGINNVAVVGCPTFFEAGPSRTVARKAPCKVNSANKICGTGLFCCVDTEHIQFFLQCELAYLRSMYPSSHWGVDTQGVLKQGYKNYASTAVRAFREHRMRFFTSMTKWKETLSDGFLFAAGTRVHGSIIAINSGVPALCTNGDMRAREMCTLFNIPLRPGWCLSDMTAEEVYDLIDIAPLNAGYQERYRSFFHWLETLNLSPRYDASDPEANWNVGELKLLPENEKTERFNAILRQL